MSLFSRTSGGRRDALGGGSNPGNKPVCKFYLEGRCRFGDACHNYHPPRDQSQNGARPSNQTLPYLLNPEHVKADFTSGDERPGWPLSAYGPGRDAPRQLIEGELEQSPEELRVQYYLAKASGSTQGYEQSEQQALGQAEVQAQKILSDLDGAIKYVIDGKDQHPNREDMVQKSVGSFRWNERPSYDQAAAPAAGTALGQPSSSGAFGQPSSSGAFGSGNTSAFGSKPGAFGSANPTPAFGQPSSGGTGFGQTSQLGGGASAFGKPSGLGGGSTGFGQPSALGAGSTPFGKPSPLGGIQAFGQGPTNNAGPTFGQSSAPGNGSTFGLASTPGTGSAFGQASAPGTSGAFGQASALGGGTTLGKPSPFGAAATANAPAFGSSTPFGAQASTGSSAFGQASQPGQQQPAFGQASQPAAQSTFGKPSPFGSASGTTSTFGQASSQPAFGSSTAFGASSTNNPAFGQPSAPGQQQSPFASANTNGTAFGKPSAPGQQQTPFGGGSQPTAFGTSSGQPTAFGSGAQSSTGGFGSQLQQQQSPAANRAPGAPLTTWKGKRVSYENSVPYFQNDAGKQERIWMPDGAPGPNPDVEAPPEVYEALGSALKQVYDYVRDAGSFKDGIIPEVPPKREWVSWDL